VDDVVVFPTIGCRLSTREIYRRVRFDEIAKQDSRDGQPDAPAGE